MYTISTEDFDLDYTLDCGQVFRWDKDVDWWTGVVNNAVARISQNPKTGELLVDSSLDEDFFYQYFRLDDDLPAIFEQINKDEHMDIAINKYRGLRLIRQEPWECLISYMLATASNIPRIKKNISMLSAMFGEELEDGLYSFPKAEDLASTCCDDLCECKMGFRTARIIKAANAVVTGDIVLDELFRLDYQDAKKELMSLEGIGEKVADCIVLFAFDKMEGFPVDTHVEKIVRTYYGDDPFFEGKATKTKIGNWGRHYFGKYCGYAQQYLFYQKRLEGLI
ncbi:DNA-3-methyladenine glycosylase [Methanococcoides methylutens]|uniref:DNA-(apurinic or apyrimidinic site) lyase n=1 Tax=Methanococcoides methylutens MM1 TaxID=1434104 RepID=A0A0E3SRL1_METMT|nr:DNA glycosylase [Methanococcoides methylutens]AKB85621.1 8-oxoguanine DNA glycosylase [Methanococcoides methylutens MM1]